MSSVVVGAALALSAVGLGIATYLTVDHYTGTLPVCSASGVVDCAKVTTSPQSVVLGIPVAVLGLAYFVVMTALNLPAAWRSERMAVGWARLLWSLVGMGMVLYLLSAELFAIKAICLWCTGVHVVTFALFVLVLASFPALAARNAPARGAGDEDDEELPSIR